MEDINLNIIPKAVDTAVTNLSDAPTKAIGQTLSEIWYLILGGPVHQAALKREARYAIAAEKFKDEVIEKVEKIPKENLVEPDFQVTSTAFENSKFCLENDVLRKMFAELISAASDSSKSSIALPIFSDIIRKLTSRDASNLAAFGNTNNYPIATYRQWFGSKGYVDCMKNVFLQNERFKDLRNQSISINTLCSLGLVEVTYEKKFDTALYQKFYKTEDYKAFSAMCKQYSEMQLPEEFKVYGSESHIEVLGGMIELTDLGSDFKRICLPE